MNRSVFQPVGGSAVANVYDLYGSNANIDPSGTDIPSFYSSKTGGNIFNRSASAWDFVLAGNSRIASPVIFYSTASGPPAAGGAKLVIDTWSPQITPCWSSDVISADMHADNTSAGYFQSYYYTIDGAHSADGAIACSVINPNASIYSYHCTIPVSKFPACTAPGTSTIRVVFNYAGGVQISGSFPVTLSQAAAKLTLSSLLPAPFDCGIDSGLTAKLQVSNPAGVTPKTYYSFDSKNFNALNCTGSGSSYTCTISENALCQLVQESLQLTFKFVYGETEVLSLPSDVLVTFPPPSLGIDTLTPQSVEAGKTTAVNVLLHVNYPDFITYTISSFSYKYLSKDFATMNCSLETSYSNIKYYKCSASLEIPQARQGVETLSFRLDGFMNGATKQLNANAFFQILQPAAEPSLRIISTSSPLDCVQSPSLTVTARTDNIQGTPNTTYSVDGGKSYNTLACSASGVTYTCTIPKDDLCDLMSSSLTLLLKFTYSSKEITSNPQNVYVTLPEPHMQVYSIAPDTLTAGGENTLTVNLFIQYPKMVGDNPAFAYTYLGKSGQTMTCSKESSTSNRDFYTCAGTQFDIPESYAQSSLPVLFSVQGTTLSFPMNILVSSFSSQAAPWLEIVSTTPAKLEAYQGNHTSASLYVTVHNAAENQLKHEATLVSNSWISGTCAESNIEYYFNCNVTITAASAAAIGVNHVSVTLKISGKKAYDVSKTLDVYVLAEQAGVDIQSASPDTLYCEGQTQQNQDTVKISATAKNIQSFTLSEETITFNGASVSQNAKYCTQQGQSITCTIPSDKLLEKVKCGSGELVPGGGSHYYPLRLAFLVKSGSQQMSIGGTKDIAVVARPLEPYVEVVDNDVAAGAIQSPINCLGSKSLKLGDSGYVRIMYADLLHAEAKDDLTWSFRLDAQDDKGKLTKGMGVSPEANSTICKLKSQQKMGAHRIEDYECSLYLDYRMFQRCEDGEGQLMLTALSATGKKAEATLDAQIVRDDRLYQIEMDIITTPVKELDCQIQGRYGKGVSCSIASGSNQNVTLRVYNANEEVELTDLSVYGFDVKMTGDTVAANERALGGCRKEADSDKYVCPFQIGPLINLPDEPGYNVTDDPDQTFEPISMGSANISVYVKYAGDLAKETISKLDGSIAVKPMKSDAMVNAEKMKKKMQDMFDSVNGIFKTAIKVLSFCAVCSAGNAMIDNIKGAIKGVGGDSSCKEICNADQTCDKTTGKCITTLTECEKCIRSGKIWCDDAKCRVTDDRPVGISCTAFSDACSSLPQGSSSSGSGGEWMAVAVSAVIGILTFVLLLDKMKLFSGSVEGEKNDLTTAMEGGLKWGFITCVLPRLVGEIGGWIAEENSSWEKGFNTVSAIGSGMRHVCNVVMNVMPLIMSFIQFWIAYLQFDMCMDMVQSEVEAGSRMASSASSEAYATQAELTASKNVMSSMMQCFSTFTGAFDTFFNKVLTTATYVGTMGNYQTSFRVSYGGRERANGDNIEGDGELDIQSRMCDGFSKEQTINIVCNGGGDTHTDDCSYTSPATTTSGTPVTWNFGQQSSNFMTLKFSTSKCKDGDITITATATKTKSIVLHYTKGSTTSQQSQSSTTTQLTISDVTTAKSGDILTFTWTTSVKSTCSFSCKYPQSQETLDVSSGTASSFTQELTKGPPLDLPAGTYECKMTCTAGTSTATKDFSFTI